VLAPVPPLSRRATSETSEAPLLQVCAAKLVSSRALGFVYFNARSVHRSQKPEDDVIQLSRRRLQSNGSAIADVFAHRKGHGWREALRDREPKSKYPSMPHWSLAGLAGVLKIEAATRHEKGTLQICALCTKQGCTSGAETIGLGAARRKETWREETAYSDSDHVS
jgi:hypothetical protein